MKTTANNRQANGFVQTSGAARLRWAPIACAMVLLAGAAHADVRNVDTTTSYDTLADAYAAANNGETLELDDGTYVLDAFPLNKGVDIRAETIGGVVIQGPGVASGFPIVISADMTLSGLRFTSATAAFSLRDQAVTVNLEDVVFHGMNHGVTHQNQAGGTAGQINITRATFYDLVEEAVYVFHGGAVVVTDAVFVDLPGLGLLLGDNEGADTLQVSGHVLANTPNSVNDANLATLSGLVAGTPELADPDNGNFALIEGTAGVTDGFGINLLPAPRVTVAVTGNGETITNGDATTTAANSTDFGAIHVSDNQISAFSIDNNGFADDLTLTPVLGDFVRITGGDAEQFSVLTQPSSGSVAPQSSAGFEVIYSPTAVGMHQSTVVFNNNVDDPYVFAVSGQANNAAPVANDDSASVAEDGTASIAVLGNDTDADLDDLSVSSASLVSGEGVVTHQANAVEYAPAADFNGPASISYVATDGFASDTATVNVTVDPVNDAPVANADSATTDEDTLVLIDVLDNDTDVDGDTLAISSAAVESGGGNVIVNEGLLEFTPATNSNDDAALSYVVTDGELTATGSVTVEINAVNDAPVANPDTATTEEDTVAVIDVLDNDTDPDGDTLTLSSASVVSGGGSVVVSEGLLDYTPPANSNDPAVLSYVVSDGTLTSTGSVSVTITPVNDAPVAQPDTAETAEDTVVLIDVLANDTDIDGDALSIASAAVQSGGGTVIVSGDRLEFTPAENSTDTATLSYMVSDGELTATASVTVTVTPENDAPTANPDAATTPEDTTVVIDVLANDSDVEGDPLNLVSAAVESGGGSVVVSGGVVEFTPAQDSNADVTLSYVISDGALSSTGNVLVGITPVNDAPVAVDDDATVQEDTPTALDVLANDADIDGDTLTVVSASIASGPGSVEVRDGAVQYTPAANGTEGASLGYTMSDGEFTATATVTVSITAVNDAPVANDDSTTTAEDTEVLIDVLANDTDIEGDALTLVSASVVSGGGSAEVSGGLLEFSPATDSNDDVTLSYVVSDGDLTATGSVSVAITPVNDAPVAQADTASVDEDTVAVIDVLTNDTDIDGDELTLTSAAVVSGAGSVVINNGALEYTPPANSTESAVLNYSVSDGALTATGSVTVTVNPVNDAPVAVDDAATTDEDTTVLIDVLANDGDIDGDALTVVSGAVESGDGRVEVRDGQLAFTPAADSVETVTLSYTMSDGALTDAGLVTVAITPVNDAPIAREDTIRGHYLDDIVIDVLANDGDIDSNNLFINAATAEQGTVEIVDNRMVFSLNGEWVPQTTINYTVGDGDLETSTSVTVDLNEYRAPLVIGSGEKIRRAGTLAEAAFDDIFSIAVGVSGQVFTADADVFRAVEIADDKVVDIIRNSSGHQDGSIRIAQFGNIEGLVYDADNGFVYISEVEKGTIRRFDLRRDQINTIRSGIVQPIGMALSNDGNTLYVIEHGKARVLALDLLNGIDSVLVGDGNRGFVDGVGEGARINVSVGLTVGPDDTVYLADRGNSRLRAINPATREITTLSSDFSRPTDVVVRDASTLMVLDRNAGHIKRFDLTTNAARVLESTVGQLVDPIAMDIDAAGNLYVVDSGSSQIKVFPIDTVERTETLPITSILEQRGDTQQGSYFIRDVVGTGYRGAVGGVSRQANLNDPDQVAIGGENILYHSNRQFTLMRTDLNTGRTISLFPDYTTNTLVEAGAYGLGISRWGHINGMAYSVAENVLYVFAGGNTLFNINLDDNSFRHLTVSGLATGGDFTAAFDGSIYMADTGGNRIVQIDPGTGAILATFGSRDGVTLSSPTDVDIASNGDLYIANWGLREVVKLTPSTGALSHYIFRNGGFADGSLGSAVIGGVYGLEFGDNNVLYMADRLNHAIRFVDIRDTTPILRTMAGDGTAGVLSSGGARFDNPTSVAVDFHGTVVATDDANNRIRLIGQNLSRPLSPFDAPQDILGTNPDGSPVEEGTIPLSELPIIRNSSVLQAAVAPLPMRLVNAVERLQELGDTTYTSLEGGVSIDIPAGANGSSFTLHGADLLAFTAETLDGINNAFFIRVGMRRLALSQLVELERHSGRSINELSQVVRALPDIEVLIGYSDKNLDAEAINTLPQNFQDFFDGIFDPNFGIPIFSSDGSLNLFFVQSFESLPLLVTQPMDALGVNRAFVEDTLGLRGGVVSSIVVSNIGFVIDVVATIFPDLQSEVTKDASAFAFPGLHLGLILPGLSLPAFMQDASDSFPLFQVLGFEPDPSVQLRFFMDVPVDAALGGEVGVTLGVEGALRVDMPNILNVQSLRDDPGTEPLDLRFNLSAFASGALGVSNGSIGFAEVSAGVQGALQVVNYWNNPLGVQGIGIGDASILVGGQGAAGAALNNAGAGVDVFGGITGRMACLDADNNIIGSPIGSSVYVGFKVGLPPLPTGVGLQAPLAPGLSFVDAIRCRARVFSSVVLGMGDTLLAGLPEGPERDVVQAIQNTSANSFAELQSILFAPLELAPIRHLLDGVRFSGDLSLATPGVELPNRFGTTGLESFGKIEVRDNVDAPWIPIADASISATFANGLNADFSLADYNIADLIVMDSVQGALEMPLHNILASNLNLTGRQQFFGLDSATSIDMSLRNGVEIDSRTAIDNLGEVEITAASTGTIANWPPLGPGGGIDFAGQARFDLNPNHVADQIHGAVNGVLNDANSAYRDALNVLSSKSREEEAIENEIDRTEREIRDRVAKARRDGQAAVDLAYRVYDVGRDVLSAAEAGVRWAEDRLREAEDNCRHRRNFFWWGSCLAKGGLRKGIEIAKDKLPGARRKFNEGRTRLVDAERALERAVANAANALSPRLNGYRIALFAVRTARDLAGLTVRALQAANSEVQRIGNALRDATNVQVHDASASINSLFNVIGGLEPMRTDLDIQVLDLRCRSRVNVTLPRVDVIMPASNPFGSLTQGIFESQSDCVDERHEASNSQRRAALRKQYFAQRLQNTGSVFANTAPAANDDVASASVIDSALPVRIAADNTSANTADGEFASDLTDNTLWWRWQPPSSGTYVIGASAGIADMTLQLHRAEASAPSASTLIAADFIPAADASLIVTLDAGQDYLIGVGSQLGLAGQFSLSIDAVGAQPQPSNDAATNAAEISGLGGNTTGSNAGATVSAAETAGDDLPVNATVWWKLDVTATGLYTINTLGSGIDTVLRAYRPGDGGRVSEANLAWVKTADDISVDPRSELTIFANRGESLWLSVGSKDANVGQVALNWQHTAADASQLQGDNFADAVVLDGFTAGVVRRNHGATTEFGEPLHAGTSNAASLWYRFTAPEAGNYLIDTAGSSIDLALAVYVGNTLEGLTELASSDGSRDSTGVLNSVSYSAVRVNLQAGEPVYIAQAGIREAEGDVVLNVQRFSLNDSFDNFVSIAGNGGEYSADVSLAQLEVGEPDYAEILARDQRPEVLRADFEDLLVAGSETSEEELTATLAEIYDSTLAELRTRPVQHSLWYRYSAPASGDLVLNTAGSEPDTVLVLFAGDTLENLQVLAWSDDANNDISSRLRYSVEAGQSYVIALATRSAGVARLSAALITPDNQTVANDTPETAIALETRRGSVSADNTYAAGNPDISLVSDFQSGKRVWWRYDALDNGVLVADTQGSASDTVLEVYAGAPGAVSLLTLNDNYHPSLNSSRVRVELEAGRSYWFAVDTVGGDTGELVLNTRFETALAGPDNDRFEQARVVDSDVYAITTSNVFGQYQVGEPAIEQAQRPNVVWYQWTPGSSGLATISTQGSVIDTLLAVFEGVQIDALSTMGSNDDVGQEDATSLVEVRVVAGNSYYIAVAGKRDVQGAYGLSISVRDEEVSLPQNTSAANAEVLSDRLPQVGAELTHSAAQANTGSDLVVPAGPEASSRWWRWQAQEDGHIEVSSQGSDVTPQLELYVGDTPQTIVLLAADQGSGDDGLFSRVRSDVIAGQTYFVRVSSPFSFQGAVALRFAYVNAQPDEAVVELEGAEGRVSPVVTSAGTRVWEWVATHTGVARFALTKGSPDSHVLRAYVLGEAGATEVTRISPTTPREESLPEVNFVSQRGTRYRIELTSTQALFGNPSLEFSYSSRKAVAMNSPAGQALIASLQSLVTLSFDNTGAAVPVLAADDQAIAALLAGVLDGSDVTEDALEFTLSAAQPTDGVSQLSEIQKVRFVVSNVETDSIVLSAVFNPNVAAGVNAKHDQVVLESPIFTELVFDTAGGGQEVVGVQMGGDSFNDVIASAFVSVQQAAVVTASAARAQDLLLGSTAYVIDIDLYDFLGQRFPLELDQSVLRGVDVRVPVDVDVLLAWLGLPGAGNLVEAQKRIDLAVEQGVVGVLRADSVNDLLAGNTTLVDSGVQIDLATGQMAFTTDHFSVFSLTALAPASEIDRSETVAAVTKSSGSMDALMLLVLILMLGVRRHAGRRRAVQEVAFGCRTSLEK